MAFWNTAGEPLRQFRWYMTFGAIVGQRLDGVKYALKKVDKPKAKINEITHKYLNHFYYYPGRLEWESINMTIAATLNPSVDDILYKILQDSGYVYPSSQEERNTISKPKSNAAIGNTIYITQIDSNGNVIEQWNLKKPFFTSVQFGPLDYASEEIVEIQCTIRYDSAELLTKNGNLDEGAAPPAASGTPPAR